MSELSFGDVTLLIATANAARGWNDGSVHLSAPSGKDAERRLESLFGASRVLAVYGTLAPGRMNHHVVAPLGGAWTEGVVEGDLSGEGWGSTHGFPAFWPRAGGATVVVQMLTSPALPEAWDELDEFEGPKYRRLLVAVLRPDAAGAENLYAVANIYAAAVGPERAER